MYTKAGNNERLKPLTVPEPGYNQPTGMDESNLSLLESALKW